MSKARLPWYPQYYIIHIEKDAYEIGTFWLQSVINYGAYCFATARSRICDDLDIIDTITIQSVSSIGALINPIICFVNADIKTKDALDSIDGRVMNNWY